MLTTLFIRVDDVGPLTQVTQAFLPLFRDRGLPVSYQVIPSRLTDECAHWLREEKARSPELLEYGQHGHTHEMTVKGRPVYYEFGPERDLGEQAQVIAKGRELIREKLGDALEPRLFTPPMHRFNRDTLVALGAQGFRIFSASCYAGPRFQAAYKVGRALGLTNLGRGGVSHHGGVRPEAPLTELSVSVSVDDGDPVERDLDVLMKQLEAARKLTPYVGLMAHPNAWPTDEKRDFLQRLADRVLALKDVRFATLGRIYDELH